MKILIFAIATLLLIVQLNARAAEKITVTYNDGKSDTGELLSQDPDKILLRVTMGDNHVDMPITWTRIKKAEQRSDAGRRDQEVENRQPGKALPGM